MADAFAKYRKSKRTPCAVDGCNHTAKPRGWCQKHYARWKRTGDPEAPPRPTSLPVGTRTKQKIGYVLVKVGTDHPYAEHQGWVPEHRLVMMEHLGRRLRPGENVHHKNGVRDDNRPENLELWAVPQPAGQRVADLTSVNAL